MSVSTMRPVNSASSAMAPSAMAANRFHDPEPAGRLR